MAYGERPRKQKLVYRGTEEVYLRKCQHCRCWFGTPWHRDLWCCQGCEDAAKRGEKERQNPREKKTWPNARKVEK